jgi:membrane protein YfhO
VHAALEVQDAARREQPSRALSHTSEERSSVWRREGWLWLACLLVVISLSLADGLLGNTVAYERDTAVFYFPLMSWVGQQLQHGQFPLWTPQFFGGYPIFADGEIGLAYPPALLALLSLPPDRAFIALRLLHLCLAGVGMFALVRIWRLPYASAVLAGIVFALGNFLQAQIHHENIVRTASWLPLILACVEQALRSLAWRQRMRWTLVAALALGMAGLSLHSQVLAIELLGLAAYGAMRWAIGPLGESGIGLGRRRWVARFAAVAQVCVPVVIVGLGLAAIQLLPLLELASFSARGNGIPYSEAAAYSVTPIGLLQLVFPYVFRGPGSLQWGLWTHWESYVYIGLAPLALAIMALACVRRREIAGWAAIGGIGLLLSLGQYSPINLDYLLWLLPGLSGLRAPGRFTFVVDLAGAMLAAYGLAWLMAHQHAERSRLRRVLIGLSGAAVAIGVLVFAVHVALAIWPQTIRAIVNAAYLSVPRDTYPLTSDDVLRGIQWSTDFSNPRVSGGLLGLAAVLGVLWLWHASPWRAWRGWPGVLLALAAIDLLSFGWAIHPREPLSRISAEPAAVQALEQLPSPDAAPNRVLASPVLNQVAADRLAPFGSLQEANGYSSLQFVWHRDYLGRVLYADDALLDLWSVRYILDPARFGTLSTSGGVNYLPRQALLHSPAGGALAEQRFDLRSTTPILELRFVTALMGAVDVPQGAPVAEIELRDGNDQVVGTAELQAGRDTMDWAWDLPAVQASIKHQRVRTAGTTTESGGPQPQTRNLSFADLLFDGPISATTMIVRATPPVGEFVLYGGAAIGTDGSADQLFGKTKSKYREVYADSEIRVLEDTAAFPRAFLVPNARVAPSLGSALSQMVHQPFQPDQQVILADDTTTRSTDLDGERGGHGTARVTEYGPNSVRVHTSADKDAWLVLSDTYYPGWTATVDGQLTTVLRGDVLFRVVPVPGGEHDVEFHFEPASVKLGGAISLMAFVVVVVGLVLAGRAARPGRTT